MAKIEIIKTIWKNTEVQQCYNREKLIYWSFCMIGLQRTASRLNERRELRTQSKQTGRASSQLPRKVATKDRNQKTNQKDGQSPQLAAHRFSANKTVQICNDNEIYPAGQRRLEVETNSWLSTKNSKEIQNSANVDLQLTHVMLYSTLQLFFKSTLPKLTAQSCKSTWSLLWWGRLGYRSQIILTKTRTARATLSTYQDEGTKQSK